MALQLNKNVDIITTDDRIIRNVGYVFLKPYFSSKYETEVECVMYENKTDVFPEPIEEGEEPITTKGPKGSLVVRVAVDMSDANLVSTLHTTVGNELKKLNSEISFTTDAI